MLAIAGGLLAFGAGAAIEAMLIAPWSSAPSSQVIANVPTSRTEPPAPVSADVPASVKRADIGPRTPANAARIGTTDPVGFSVQVAAVPALEEAQRMHAQLSGAGYPGYLTLTTLNQVRLYRVRVGPYRSRQTAGEIAQRLERQGYQGPWIDEAGAPSRAPVRSGPIFDDWH